MAGRSEAGAAVESGEQIGRAGGEPDEPSRRATWLGVAAVAAAALAWSTSFAVTKLLLRHHGAMTVGAMRFVLGALLLAVAVRAQRGWRPPPVRRRVGMGIAGLLGITAYFALENSGVGLATASDATLIVASYPVVAIAVEFLLYRRGVSVVRALGMALAVGGVVVVAHGSSSGNGHRLLGDVLLSLGGVVWTAYNLVGERTQGGVSALTATYYQTLAGAAGFLVLSLGEAGRWRAPAAGDWLLVAYLAGVCSIGGFLCYNLGLRRVSSTTAVTVLNLVPVFGSVSAVVIAGESLGPAQFAGGALVVAGVLLSLRRREAGGGRGPRPPRWRPAGRGGAPRR
ncbi:DMT family transporter [Streptomyces sp. HPF1205]|uniref:DMT family transporter n=1 Tax=Streptomyces sp. HPF1205 TaxID=2873262 RepID=UPI001CECFD78|nr:DMT family transporter [Streptomyces sp. HPF1205]